ncbi:MAG: hypothetical protein HN608_11590 [Rhodospirillaceae bacterium]|nr:hypothetical protein [Rhodospirillaceae bacterium]
MPCTAGRFAESKTTCTSCPSGKYQEAQAQTDCKSCAAGKFRNAQPASSVESAACAACAIGGCASRCCSWPPLRPAPKASITIWV